LTSPGDTTDFFGFGESNLITLSGPAPFILNSLLMGPNTGSSTPTVSVTLLGTLSGGGTLTATFAGLSTATLETLNWADLVGGSTHAPRSNEDLATSLTGC